LTPVTGWPDGWTAVQEKRWRAPLYWEECGGLVADDALGAPLDLANLSAVTSKADAYPLGRRAPASRKLETCAGQAVEGNFVDSGLLHPRAATGTGDGQWYGDVWEWTRSAYSPYPASVRSRIRSEYNGKFMATDGAARRLLCDARSRATELPTFFYPHVAGLSPACVSQRSITRFHARRRGYREQ
jgi:hypothetical protein